MGLLLIYVASTNPSFAPDCPSSEWDVRIDSHARFPGSEVSTRETVFLANLMHLDDDSISGVS